MFKQTTTEWDAQKNQPQTLIVVFMGVCGSGKSTIGSLVAEQLNWKFYEGDEFHPHSNVDKMLRGEPLSDEDRAPWLAAIGAVIDEHLKRGEHAVISCSALKSEYRAVLQRGASRLLFVLLQPSVATLRGRLEARAADGKHFMPPSLLDSQLETLEYDPNELFLRLGPDDFENYSSPRALTASVVKALQNMLE